MAFSMPCWKKRLSPGWRHGLIGALLALFSLLANAADITARGAQLLGDDDGYVLNADFDLTLNPRLEDAIAKGVSLYFVIDFELNRSRWYWFDEQVASRSRSIQLSYHALTRQYRLTRGNLHQSFPTLGDALRILARTRNWHVLDKGQLKGDQTYQAAVRLRLDLTQMPKTFQVTALANREWTLSADWMRWLFTLAEIGQAANGDGR
ncbi:MAG TPA: DUF4390 domain-containing protein [Accumulibacter sp.]|nr:DUF4390 domain-containing protein [Accumulibacter sp.]HMX22804.1 DUF4390 domain-containing protein [Accumulibacter sp.]HMY07558.1 DUF4390 domain-containing protein [Accumulibacter sp.]HNG38076.1 DUF4390 domain-containing protein [Accumulibacter sp.]HNI74022.1 DUF4390 domain-containing protein [Accumulibacter sp.]